VKWADQPLVERIRWPEEVSTAANWWAASHALGEPRRGPQESESQCRSRTSGRKALLRCRSFDAASNRSGVATWRGGRPIGNPTASVRGPRRPSAVIGSMRSAPWATCGVWSQPRAGSCGRRTSSATTTPQFAVRLRQRTAGRWRPADRDVRRGGPVVMAPGSAHGPELWKPARRPSQATCP